VCSADWLFSRERQQGRRRASSRLRLPPRPLRHFVLSSYAITSTAGSSTRRSGRSILIAILNRNASASLLRHGSRDGCWMRTGAAGVNSTRASIDARQTSAKSLPRRRAVSGKLIQLTHTPKVAGSRPAPATKLIDWQREVVRFWRPFRISGLSTQTSLEPAKERLNA